MVNGWETALYPSGVGKVMVFRAIQLAGDKSFNASQLAAHREKAEPLYEMASKGLDGGCAVHPIPPPQQPK